MRPPGDAQGRRRHRGLGGAQSRVGQAFANQGAQDPGNVQPSEPAAPPAVDPYDFSADPILQRIQAIGERRVAEATAQALAARRQLAIDSGDESLAPDEATRLAAHNNPNSARAQFERKATEAPKALTEQDNQQNLFYSGAAGLHQKSLAQQLLGEQSDMQSRTRNSLSDIEAALQSAREGATNDVTGAQEDAASRLQARLGDLGVGGASGGGNTGGGGGNAGGGGGAGRNGARVAGALRGAVHHAARTRRRRAYQPGNRP